MTLKVIHWLQAFSSAIRRTFAQYFTRFQLTACSRGPAGTAALLVVYNLYNNKWAVTFATAIAVPVNATLDFVVTWHSFDHLHSLILFTVNSHTSYISHTHIFHILRQYQQYTVQLLRQKYVLTFSYQPITSYRFFTGCGYFFRIELRNCDGYRLIATSSIPTSVIDEPRVCCNKNITSRH